MLNYGGIYHWWSCMEMSDLIGMNLQNYSCMHIYLLWLRRGKWKNSLNFLKVTRLCQNTWYNFIILKIFSLFVWFRSRRGRKIIWGQGEAIRVKVMGESPDSLAYAIDMATRFDEDFTHSWEIHKKEMAKSLISLLLDHPIRWDHHHGKVNLRFIASINHFHNFRDQLGLNIPFVERTIRQHYVGGKWECVSDVARWYILFGNVLIKVLDQLGRWGLWDTQPPVNQPSLVHRGKEPL